MLRLIEFLLYGHLHKWGPVVMSGKIQTTHNGVEYNAGLYEVRKCEICHMLKDFKSC